MLLIFLKKYINKNLLLVVYVHQTEEESGLVDHPHLFGTGFMVDALRSVF